MRHLNKLLLAIFLLAAVNFMVQAAEEESPDEAITACCKLEIDNSDGTHPKIIAQNNLPPSSQNQVIQSETDSSGNSPSVNNN